MINLSKVNSGDYQENEIVQNRTNSRQSPILNVALKAFSRFFRSPKIYLAEETDSVLDQQASLREKRKPIIAPSSSNSNSVNTKQKEYSIPLNEFSGSTSPIHIEKKDSFNSFSQEIDGENHSEEIISSISHSFETENSSNEVSEITSSIGSEKNGQSRSFSPLLTNGDVYLKEITSSPFNIFLHTTPNKPSNAPETPYKNLGSQSLKIGKEAQYQTCIETLGIRKYSPEVQKKIVSCFLEKNPILNLSHSKLSEVPDCISDFPHLRSLNLSANKLTSFKLKLENLEELNLSSNEIDEFKVEMKNNFKKPNLIRLNIRNNKLKELQVSLPNLEYLNLSNNKFTICKSTGGQFPNLVNLNFSHNKLAHFNVYFPKFESLDLNKNELTEFALTSEQIPEIRHLNLENNKIESPLEKTKFPKLKTLKDNLDNLRNNIRQLNIENYSLEVQKKIIASYDEKSPLLDLSSCNLTHIPECLSTFSWINHLNLSDNQLKILPVNLPSLKELNVSNNQFTDFPWREGQFSDLQTLNISGNQLTTFFISKDRVRESFPRLENLDISMNPIDDINLNSHKLRTLNLSNNQNLLQFSLNINRIPHLNSLDISGTPVHLKNPPKNILWLKQDDVQEVHQKIVTKLNIETYDPKVQEKIIDCFQSGNPCLALRGHNLTKVPNCISTHLFHLKTLDLSENQLSEFSLEKMPHLTHLNLSNNQFVKFLYVKELLPRLTNLYFDYNWTREFSSRTQTYYIENSLLDSKEAKAHASKETLIRVLGVEEYSQKAQTQILDCFIKEAPILDLGNCELKTVPLCLFKHFKFLTHLNLANNQIENFSANKNQFPNLEELDLSYNGMDDDAINTEDLDIITENLN